MNLEVMVNKAKELGYEDRDARAKVCQDIVLEAISSSSLNRNVTIKGGVVMRSISNNIRRATQDMDIDFIRYSLSNESIYEFFRTINCLKGIQIEAYDISNLKQKDYKGKSVKISIIDNNGYLIRSKIDFGVHNHLEIEQEEYCFDIYQNNDGASLLINSKEQMFTEKLKSLLIFGTRSTRYKDIYDMYYLSDALNHNNIKTCFNTFIFSTDLVKENNINDIVFRLNEIFNDSSYIEKVSNYNNKWIDDDIDIIFKKIIEKVQGISNSI